ncbi:MAG: hypothetical protein IKM51_04520 [Oscillospiraceae bacterium]|nr:hypothetical protein [Oscillospiraceae bacterium]
MKIVLIVLIVFSLLFAGYLHENNGTEPAYVAADSTLEDVPEYLPAPSLDPKQTPKPKPTPEPDMRHWSEKEIAAPAVPMGGQSAPEGMVMLKDLPYYYRAAEGETDGCVTYYYDDEGNNYQGGNAVWDDFVAKTVRGEPAMVRRVQDYTCESFDRAYSKTADIEFDGEKYIVRRYYRDQMNGAEYEILDVYTYVTEWDKENNALITYYKDRAEAVADGCVIFKGNEQLSSGGEMIEDFLGAVERGEKARIRVACNEAYGSSIYNVYEIAFDGENFIYTSSHFSGLIRTSVYPYMLTFDVPSHGGTQYMLAYSEIYKWSELSAAWGALMSSSDEGWLSYDRAFVIPIDE